MYSGWILCAGIALWAWGQYYWDAALGEKRPQGEKQTAEYEDLRSSGLYLECIGLSAIAAAGLVNVFGF